MPYSWDMGWFFLKWFRNWVLAEPRWFAPDRRGLALGILSVGYGLGFATVGAGFPWIENHYCWRYAWHLLSFLTLCMVIFKGLLLRTDPAPTGTVPWGLKKPSEGPNACQIIWAPIIWPLESPHACLYLRSLRSFLVTKTFLRISEVHRCRVWWKKTWHLIFCRQIVDSSQYVKNLNRCTILTSS